MAPAISPRSLSSSSQHMRSISRSVSSTLSTISTSKDTTSISKTPIASILALILRETIQFSKRTLLSSPSRRAFVEPIFLTPRAPSLETSNRHTLDKRQTQILAIPTTYAGLNSGPQPGALVGIVVGSIAGFILILYVLLTLFRLRMNAGGGTIVEEKIIRHSHRRRPSRSASRTSRSASRVISETHSPRRERVVREEETVIVEEQVSSVDDDIVEVIEEHSPERPPARKQTRSGFRTVDPAEFGGGGRPIRKVGRR